MTIAVTGAGGFLGWHVRCRAFARGLDTVPVRRELMAEPRRLDAALREVDAVVHCAGVNRGREEEVTDGNLAAAQGLVDAIRRLDRPVRIVYANSVHARGDGTYATAKRKAGELLAGAATGGYCDVLLPNLYGEHGRPHYNSFVATFCHEVAGGRRPAELRDREVALLAAPDAADTLVALAGGTESQTVRPAGTPVRVSEVLRLLEEFESAYRDSEIPDLSDPFRTRLFHTYRSHLFPQRYPIALPRHVDGRGSLVECVRSHAGGGQSFVSTTMPGQVRGEHVHLRKFERFVVVDGRAEIALRRLFTGEVIRFRVTGDRPVVVDMPTFWSHRLTSLDGPVTTLFWTNEPYRADDPDTYPCAVDGGRDTP